MQRIGGHVRRTPVIATRAGELGLTYGVTLKLELLQYAGSFKTRGAFNRVLSAAAQGGIGSAGVIAASGGNHGAALAFVAGQLGYPAEIFVPSTSPAIKRDRIAGYGARVNVIDGYFDDAQTAAVQRQLASGALAVHPFEHIDIVAGQGTMSMEIDDQVGDYDTLIVATGGGGFIAGQAAWVQDRRRVVSVEPITSCCLHAARLNGAPVQVEVAGVAADSLGTRQLGAVAWSIVRNYVDDAVLVHDDDIRSTQRALWDEFRLVVEPGGAAALAALRSGAYVPEAGERVVVAVCGSNCDPATVTA
ncbi:MAG: pyridoxal-phosphate dependent enzyme [Actinobacteria bacterium]|nr:pyridoxal-phosphate dependent enzyme [Actinomycetota bacterium]